MKKDVQSKLKKTYVFKRKENVGGSRGHFNITIKKKGSSDLRDHDGE